jgi:hypothetical protein
MKLLEFLNLKEFFFMDLQEPERHSWLELLLITQDVLSLESQVENLSRNTSEKELS